jgi:Kef-type K+ transport system membrane component KefB
MEEDSIQPGFNFRKLFFYISPCLLVSIYCIIAIIGSYSEMESSKGWSFLGVIIFKPILICTVLTDIAARIMLYKKILLFWIIEILAITVIFYFLFLPYV